MQVHLLVVLHADACGRQKGKRPYGRPTRASSIGGRVGGQVRSGVGDTPPGLHSTRVERCGGRMARSTGTERRGGRMARIAGTVDAGVGDGRGADRPRDSAGVFGGTTGARAVGHHDGSDRRLVSRWLPRRLPRRRTRRDRHRARRLRCGATGGRPLEPLSSLPSPVPRRRWGTARSKHVLPHRPGTCCV